jgi:predicted lactoylglutathione lyase
MEQRVSFLTLGVTDLGRARGFYEALGWTAAKYGEGAGVVFFEIGPGLVLALYPRADLARDANLPDAGPAAFSGVSLSYNTRSREEVDAIMAETQRAGGRVLTAAAEVFWGGYVGYFADPEGHLWEVAFNPKAEIAANGAISLPR